MVSFCTYNDLTWNQKINNNNKKVYNLNIMQVHTRKMSDFDVS